MSNRTRMILVVFGIVALCAAWFFFFIRPRQAELANVRADTVEEENKTLALQTELDRLEQLQANAPALEAELAVTRRLIPSENEVANYIFLVEEAATQADIDFVNVTPELPKPPPEGAPLAEIRTVIGAEGGYFEIQDFFRRLYGLDRAVRVDLMTLAPAGDAAATDTVADPAAANKLRLDLTARIFFEPPEGASSASAAPAPATTTP
ncbi:MAG: type 4a pilus biogenesis protein PilO [Actinomycetota bacterium]|nr:type 4a pilus biogenesis protein PilO [Actinomycetota bacterium]